MKKGEAKDFLPLVKALAEGKTIQFMQSNEPDSSFIDCNWSNFSFDAKPHQYRVKQHQYRVKPDAIDMWCLVISKGHVVSNYKTKEIAEKNLAELIEANPGMFDDCTVELFRQVLK